MKCPKCGGQMKETPTNVELTLPTTGAVGRGLYGPEVDVPAKAFVCEKCGYVEFYNQY